MDPVLVALCARHGCFLRREVLELGYHDRAIASLVRAGSWHRVRHGAYTLGEIWLASDLMERHLITSRAAYRTAETDVVLSHTSSLAKLGTASWALPLRDVHLTRRDGRSGRHVAGVVQHRGRVSPDDVQTDGDLSWMGATRTGLEITTMTDVERGLIVVNDLLHRGLTTRPLLVARYDGMEMWPYTLRTDLVLRLCSPLESVGETRADHLFFREGLPRPERQWEVRDANGDVLARLDFAWPELGVYVEFDGRVKYEKFRREGETAVDVLMREKRREQLVSEATGWECVRITWEDLAHPARTAARIRAAFARAAARHHHA